LLAIGLGPQNTAIVLTQASTVTLPCCATADSSSGARVQWWEYGTKGRPNGNQISDGNSVSSFHPNSARYSLSTAGGQCYNLTISGVVSADGTEYVCKDVNDDPPSVVQLGANLVVICSLHLFGSVLLSLARTCVGPLYVKSPHMNFDSP
jgi:hypothetical protein